MKDLPESTCKAFLRKHRVGVMALANGGDAYAVPLFFAYDGEAIYFHSHPGEKDTFLQGTHEGSFVVVEVHGEDDWTSVQATGPVEKVVLKEDARKAFEAMAGNPFPPEFGVDWTGAPKRSGDHAYLWVMRPRKVTGRSSRSLVHLKDTGES